MKTRFAAVAVALLFSTAAPAQAATLANTNGGDGYIDFNAAPYFYTLFGSNNAEDVGFVPVLTTYSDVASSTFTQSFKWSYTTNDRDDSSYDRAGYFIDNMFVQLSPDGLPTGGTASGIINITVNAGQTFGAYVSSSDNSLGRGAISFGGVPEPATWAFMILGFGAVGGAMRRRQSVAATVRFA